VTAVIVHLRRHRDRAPSPSWSICTPAPWSYICAPAVIVDLQSKVALGSIVQQEPLFEVSVQLIRDENDAGNATRPDA